MNATTYIASGALVVCLLVGAVEGSRLARRSRAWRRAVPVTAATAALCALLLGYLASSDMIAALHATAGEYGLRLEVGGGYASLRAAVVSQAFLVAFPAGLVCGQVAAWVAHRRIRTRLVSATSNAAKPGSR